MDRQTRYDALLAAIPLPLVAGGAVAAISSGPAAAVALVGALLANALVGVGLFYRTPAR